MWGCVLCTSDCNGIMPTKKSADRQLCIYPYGAIIIWPIVPLTLAVEERIACNPQFSFSLLF